jgi:hypothetical protein
MVGLLCTIPPVFACTVEKMHPLQATQDPFSEIFPHR